MRYCPGCEQELEDGAFHRGHSNCRDCRRADYYRRRGIQCGRCDLCFRMKPLSKSGHCHYCNEVVFLRECRTCLRVLDLKSFYGYKRLCKRCLKLNRTIKATLRKSAARAKTLLVPVKPEPGTDFKDPDF